MTVHQIILAYDDKTQGFQMRGPLQNRMLCYGMLELGRETIHKQECHQPSELVIAAALPNSNGNN